MSTVPSEPGRTAAGINGSVVYAEPAWKQELNQKVAAARARRRQGQPDAAPPANSAETSETASRAAKVAAAVAARYAEAPSYSDYLASEVRTAMLASAAAQKAADQARAAADAVYADLCDAASASEELQTAEAKALVEETPASTSQTSLLATSLRSSSSTLTAGGDTGRAQKREPGKIIPRVDHAASGFRYAAPSAATVTNAIPEHRSAASSFDDPLEEALVTPATPLPAKLLEFPRELVAARKARPRHAEGPLRETGETGGQLRIFEVESSAIATMPDMPPQATEWSSIRLGAFSEIEQHDTMPAVEEAMSTPAGSSTAVTSKRPTAPYNQAMASAYSHASRSRASQSHAIDHDMLQDVAGLSDRLMAGIVDTALVGIACAVFVLVFAASSTVPLTGKPAMIGVALLIAALYLGYLFLFFTFSEGTPGMRYARIALCTFEDENPTRQAMRKRIFSLVLAAAPLGLGFLYALFDEDHLGWHDRMTRMYQRSYK